MQALVEVAGPVEWWVIDRRSTLGQTARPRPGLPAPALQYAAAAEVLAEVRTALVGERQAGGELGDGRAAAGRFEQPSGGRVDA